MKRNRLCVPVGEWQTLPHHPNLRSRISRWVGGQPFLTSEPNAVEFPGACLPQAGPILRAFVSCEGGGLESTRSAHIAKYNASFLSLTPVSISTNIQPIGNVLA
jgi:hypothetical protein